MAAKHLRTFSDIYTAVLEELKIQSTDTTNLNRVKRDINIVYIDEVLPAHEWYWARKQANVVSEAYLSTGTASLTEGSNTVTLSSAPAESQTGRLFAVAGYAEVYKIRSHTAGSTTLTLSSKFTDATGSGKSFKIWDDGIKLPTDCLEPAKVWHDHAGTVMEAQPDKSFLDFKLTAPFTEGRPSYYRVTDFEDAVPYMETVLGASTHRSSSGLVRTLTFSIAPSTLMEEGDHILVEGAGSEYYNGEFIVDNFDGNTLTYTATTVLTEASTADTGARIKLLDNTDTRTKYRKLEVYPALCTKDTTVHVEYVRDVQPLDSDDDEPIMPITDRAVLLYGALQRGWSRVRNPEEAQRNQALFQNKLAQMAGKIQDSTDFPTIAINELYTGSKRLRRRTTWENF